MNRIRAAVLALALLTTLAPGASASAMPAAPPGVAVVPAAPLPAPPGTTSLVSRARKGTFANGPSAEPVISENGRFVAFTSVASDLVAGDVPDSVDVFVFDRSTGRITRAALPAGVAPSAQAMSSEPSISASGRYVAFTYKPAPSVTTLYVPVIRTRIVIWDRKQNVAKFAALDAEGLPLQGSQPAISGDGRYVAFTTTDELEDEYDDGQADVVRVNRETGRTVLVTPGIFRGFIAGDAITPSISRDGRYVAFASDGGDSVIDEDTGPGYQVYVRDLTAGVTEQISVAMGGGPARAESTEPAISGDGRYVAFSSNASNLTPERAAGVFRRDRLAGITELVSVAPDGSPGDRVSAQPAISENGSMVAFASAATNLVPETLGRIAPAAFIRLPTEVYLRDLDARETVLISVTLDNGPSGTRSQLPSVGAAGRFTVFASDSDQLVRNDDNKGYDAFLRDLPPVPSVAPPTLDLGARAVGTDSLPLAATLTNTGWSPLEVTGASIAGAQPDDFEVVLDGCAERTLRRNEACSVSVIFRPTDRGTRTARLEIADAYDGSPRTIRLRGAASKAELVLDPPIGEPGIVTIVEGSGFPPGVPIRVSWTIGITPKLRPIITDETGSFRVPVLVFHNDRTGIRELLVEPLDGTAFPSISEPMLVTRPSVVPPRFELLRFIDVPFVLVIRG